MSQKRSNSQKKSEETVTERSFERWLPVVEPKPSEDHETKNEEPTIEPTTNNYESSEVPPKTASPSRETLDGAMEKEPVKEIKTDESLEKPETQTLEQPEVEKEKPQEKDAQTDIKQEGEPKKEEESEEGSTEKLGKRVRTAGEKTSERNPKRPRVLTNTNS